MKCVYMLRTIFLSWANGLYYYQRELDITATCIQTARGVIEHDCKVAFEMNCTIVFCSFTHAQPAGLTYLSKCLIGLCDDDLEFYQPGKQWVE